MKKNKTIKFKAALLLLVFSLNTLLGFACSLGLDMGYNKHHHLAKVTGPAKHMAGHMHNGESKLKKELQHHHANRENNNDDCCGNGVTSFNLLNKTVPNQVELVHPTVDIDFIANGFTYKILIPYTNIEKDIKPFARTHHPPIPDIRIAIQSFLI